jgi:hypothetical protein
VPAVSGAVEHRDRTRGPRDGIAQRRVRQTVVPVLMAVMVPGGGWYRRQVTARRDLERYGLFCPCTDSSSESRLGTPDAQFRRERPGAVLLARTAQTRPRRRSRLDRGLSVSALHPAVLDDSSIVLVWAAAQRGWVSASVITGRRIQEMLLAIIPLVAGAVWLGILALVVSLCKTAAAGDDLLETARRDVRGSAAVDHSARSAARSLRSRPRPLRTVVR